MAKTALRGNAVSTNSDLPAVGAAAPPFSLVKGDLSPLAIGDLAGQRVILNIFPSIDTGVCQASVREFNKRAAELDGTTVVCVSADLPFAASRFCGAEGIENVVTGSTFRGDFLQDYGVKMVDGPLEGLAARAVVVIDGGGQVTYTQLTDDITEEPDYDAAIRALA